LLLPCRWCIRQPKYIGKQSNGRRLLFYPPQITMLGEPTMKYMADILVSRDTLSLSLPIFLVHCAVKSVLIYFLLVELLGRKHNFRGWAQPKFTAGRRRKIFSHSKPLWGCQRRCGSSDMLRNGSGLSKTNTQNQPKYLHALDARARSCATRKNWPNLITNSAAHTVILLCFSLRAGFSYLLSARKRRRRST
jgi:hypothetical protein